MHINSVGTYIVKIIEPQTWKSGRNSSLIFVVFRPETERGN
jgi:hypothetical protein